MNNVIKGIELIILSFPLIFKISAANYRTWLLFAWIITDTSEVNVSLLFISFLVDIRDRSEAWHAVWNRNQCGQLHAQLETLKCYYHRTSYPNLLFLKHTETFFQGNWRPVNLMAYKITSQFDFMVYKFYLGKKLEAAYGFCVLKGSRNPIPGLRCLQICVASSCTYPGKWSKQSP